jgi:hypothetical protein
VVPLVDVLQLMLPPMLLDKSRFVGWQVRYLTQPNGWPLQTKLTPHLHTAVCKVHVVSFASHQTPNTRVMSIPVYVAIV